MENNIAAICDWRKTGTTQYEHYKIHDWVKKKKKKHLSKWFAGQIKRRRKKDKSFELEK